MFGGNADAGFAQGDALIAKLRICVGDESRRPAPEGAKDKAIALARVILPRTHP